MNIVLRVTGAALDLDECLKWVPSDSLTQTWRVGERDLLKRPISTNGFSVNLADNDDSKKALEEACITLELVSAKIEQLVQEDASVQVDFGLFVTGPMPEILVLPQPLLRKLVDLGVEIIISAYPCSDG